VRTDDQVHLEQLVAPHAGDLVERFARQVVEYGIMAAVSVWQIISDRDSVSAVHGNEITESTCLRRMVWLLFAPERW